MIDHYIRSAAHTIGSWRSRRAAKGKPPTEDDTRREVASRWPDMAPEQIKAVVALCVVPRDDR